MTRDLAMEQCLLNEIDAIECEFDAPIILMLRDEDGQVCSCRASYIRRPEVRVQRVCIACHRQHTFWLNRDQVWMLALKHLYTMEEIFPQMKLEDREFFASNFCGRCQKLVVK